MLGALVAIPIVVFAAKTRLLVRQETWDFDKEKELASVWFGYLERKIER